MKTQGAIPTRSPRPTQGRALPTPGAAQAARLPFLDPAPAEAGHDLLVLNPRDDLATLPAFTTKLGAYFEVILS
ncbi:MAG TPA: hypothetical protein VGD88_08145 [Opitutaceae bacterium]